MQISMNDAQVDVQPIPGGQGKMIVCVDKAGNSVVIPLGNEAAKLVGMKLTTSLLVAAGALAGNGGNHG